MNYLAHLVLAEPDAPSWAGSLMPDMVRGRLPVDLPEPVMQAVHEHRLVDRLTDSHAAFISLKQHLFVKWGRFAGPLTDILLDHALSVDWAKYVAQPRATFIKQVYTGLAEQQPHLPLSMQRTLDYMFRHDWLSRYASQAGIRLTLVEFSYRLSRRFDRPVNLAPAANTLPELLPRLRETFAQLMPDLQQAVANSRC